MSRSPAKPASSDEKSSAPSYKPDPKAVALIQEADKKLSKSGFFSMLSGGNKYEEGRELLQKAAAQFKISKQWQEAGDAYARSAEIADKQLKDVHEACTDYVNAAKAYKNVSGELSIRYLQRAVDLHMENNKFSQAARLWKEMAEMQEKEMNYDAAGHCYEKAADCFQAEDSRVNAASCMIKVADLALEQEKFARAIEIYDKVSNDSLDNTAARWSIKDYLFKALICHLAIAAKSNDQSMEPVEEAINKYTEMLPSLEGNNQHSPETIEPPHSTSCSYSYSYSLSLASFPFVFLFQELVN